MVVTTLAHLLDAGRRVRVQRNARIRAETITASSDKPSPPNFSNGPCFVLPDQAFFSPPSSRCQFRLSKEGSPESAEELKCRSISLRVEVPSK
jgi:hypothetical protein